MSTIRFLWAEGSKGPENIRRLSAQYRDQTLPRSAVCHSLKLFKDGPKSVSDNASSGRPVAAATDENITPVERLIFNDRRVSVIEIAHEVDISAGGAYDIIRNKLKFHKVVASSLQMGS